MSNTYRLKLDTPWGVTGVLYYENGVAVEGNPYPDTFATFLPKHFPVFFELVKEKSDEETLREWINHELAHWHCGACSGETGAGLLARKLLAAGLDVKKLIGEV